MLKNTAQRLRRDRRGISNVVVVMLSLVLVVIIVANVVLWNYQMNQLDWERIQERVEITDASSADIVSWFTAQTEYTINKGSHIGGTYTDTQTMNSQYETFTEGFTQQTWLGNWNKRIQIAINHTAIDGTLANFPLLIYLSSSSGPSHNNLTCVFNELQTKDLRKKIAVTTADGLTQCYAEIEKWDDTNHEAWIWVKAPSISNTQDTSFYLYYDQTQPDNSAYVGDPGSTAAQGVWDSNYKLVMHLQEATGTQYDSTANHNDGTPQNGISQNAAGIVDGADHLDGTDDQVQISDSPSLSFTSNELTLEGWTKFDSLPAGETVIARKDNQWQMGFETSSSIRNLVSTDGATGWTGANDENYPLQTNTWYYCTFVYDGSKITHEINGEQVGSTHTVTGNINDNSSPLYLGYCVYSGVHVNGFVDEVRVSDIARSAVWVRATYQTEKDTLASYGNEESVSDPRYGMDIVGNFNIDPVTYPLSAIQTVEIQLIYRASDTGETWYLKAYNWTDGNYSDSGFNSTAGNTPASDWNIYALNLTGSWQSYISTNGTMCIKFTDSQPDSNQTTIDIDYLAIKALAKGTAITIQNTGSLTAHLASLWITNTTSHQRYDIGTYINQGNTVQILRTDVTLTSAPYMIKIVTEKGNTAVYSSH
jgi:hypothetical protein